MKIWLVFWEWVARRNFWREERTDETTEDVRNISKPNNESDQGVAPNTCNGANPFFEALARPIRPGMVLAEESRIALDIWAPSIALDPDRNVFAGRDSRVGRLILAFLGGHGCSDNKCAVCV